MSNMEEWRTLPYLPPNVEISDRGNVRMYVTSVDTKLLHQTASSGYRVVSINGSQYAVHRMVADAFLPPVSDPNLTDFVVNHKNGNKSDNRVSNLERISRTDNLIKSFQRSSEIKQKFYCPELDEVYGTVRSIAVSTKIPQEIVSMAIRNNLKIFGLTFKQVEATDPIVKTHDIIYISYDNLLNIAVNTDSLQAKDEAISSSIERIKPIED